MNNKEFYKLLDEMVPNPHCTLDYSKDYELLIATVLSAQCTDERVNQVTPGLFKYDIKELSKMLPTDIVDIIRPCGNMNRKSEYIIEIAKRLVKDYDGKVPNNREYLESLPGVGRKVCNVVLANLFDEPAFAVDTHVFRVSKRLGIANESDNVIEVEKKLMKEFPKEKWLRLHHQLLLLGRYTCTAKSPKCDICKMKKYCQKYKER
jgi:endonuclease-3